MKRAAVVVLLALAMVFAVAPAAMPSASPEGALTSLFNTFLGGAEAQGIATFERGGQAAYHAAASSALNDTFDGSSENGGAIRLSPVPGWPAGPFCDNNIFGIWIVYFGAKADLQGEFDEAILLNGVELDSKYTPLKPIVDPLGDWRAFLGEKGWWFSFGVPVYGTLEPGFHEVAYAFDGEVVLSSIVEVAACP